MRNRMSRNVTIYSVFHYYFSYDSMNIWIINSLLRIKQLYILGKLFLKIYVLFY